MGERSRNIALPGASEPREESVQPLNCPTQGKIGFEWVVDPSSIAKGRRPACRCYYRSMFATPTDALTFEQVQSFCQALPRENVTLDYKLDFPKRLDKTIAAFANTCGGYILIGVDETVTGEPVLPIGGVPLVGGLRERVVATALDAIFPPVSPEVKVVEFKSPGATSPDRAVVVVRVHESDNSAHAVDGGKTVYLRVDNISDHFIRQATIPEVEWLLNKRQRSLELKERLLSEARKRAANYLVTYRTARHLSTAEPRGKYVLWTIPTFPRSELASPGTLLELSRKKGWRANVQTNDILFDFPHGDAIPIFDGIRHPSSPAGNYWYTEVNRFGLIYTEVGFTGRGEEYAEAIVSSLIASLIMASLRFALSLYEATGFGGLMDFHLEVTPTLNKYLFVPSHFGGDHRTDYRSLDNSIALGFTLSVREARESLVLKVTQLYREFFWAFGIDLSESNAAGHLAAFAI